MLYRVVRCSYQVLYTTVHSSSSGARAEPLRAHIIGRDYNVDLKCNQIISHNTSSIDQAGYICTDSTVRYSHPMLQSSLSTQARYNNSTVVWKLHVAVVECNAHYISVEYNILSSPRPQPQHSVHTKDADKTSIKLSPISLTAVLLYFQ